MALISALNPVLTVGWAGGDSTWRLKDYEARGGYGAVMTQVLPEMMQAVGYDAPGGADVLKIVTLPVPHPAAGQVLVQVAYAGVNRPDIIQRMGQYPAPAGHSPILGLEVSGEIVALGEGVDPVLLGQQVCALVNGGGYAEYCLAEAGVCLPLPEGLGLAEAAAMANACWCMAAPAASALWPSRWARLSGWR